jgi:hypothetical protein
MSLEKNGLIACLMCAYCAPPAVLITHAPQLVECPPSFLFSAVVYSLVYVLHMMHNLCSCKPR